MHDETETMSRARIDRDTFKQWETGHINTAQGCDRIAKNNRLTSVAEEDFIETAHSLGYYRRFELPEWLKEEEEK